jgi:tetratricopeptide (TPR) repeat protein
MTGPFRIAMAHFGEVDSRGRVRATEKGAVLSKWFFDNLAREFTTASTDVAGDIAIWHDDQPGLHKNVTFGIMRGDTAEERRQSAAKLASRIAAHMVIYGALIPGPDRQQLALEFYLSPLVNDETATLLGAHRLGKPIELPPFDTGDPQANIAVARLLQPRADAFFALTVGLTQSILGQSAAALETFQQAERMLTNWREEDGKEILYFFIGREELFLGHIDNALANFNRALEIEPDYARARIALGSAYLKRARTVPPTERFAPPSDLEAALANHLAGLELARQTQEPLVEQIAHLALAKSYRLFGETYYHLGNDGEARRYFELTRQEATGVVEPLTAANQHRLVAQAYETEGAAYLQEADLLLRQDRPGESQPLLDKAKAAYQQCIDQGKRVVDAVLESQIIEQGCRRYYAVADEFLQTLKEREQ